MRFSMINTGLAVSVLSLINAGLLIAETTVAPRLEILRADSGMRQAPVYDVFGGQSVKVNVVLDPLGNRMGEVKVHADLFQKAQSLLAPLQKDLVVNDNFHFGFRNDDPAQIFPWTLAIPEVKRKTQILVRFRILPSTNKPTPVGSPPSVPLGQENAVGMLLNVYPKDVVKDDLRQIATRYRFCLFGTNSALRDFLKAQKVGFGDSGPNLNDLPQQSAEKSIYLGDANPQQLSQWLTDHPDWRGVVVVFCSDSALLPGVFVTHHGGIQLAKITFPLLDTLSTDPRSQNTLLEILNSITPAAP